MTGLQEILLKVLLIHIVAAKAQFYQNLDGSSQEVPFDLLAIPLFVDPLQDKISELKVNILFPKNILLEQNVAHGVNVLLFLLHHEVPVKIHVDVPDHLEGSVMLVPQLNEPLHEVRLQSFVYEQARG